MTQKKPVPVGLYPQKAITTFEGWREHVGRPEIKRPKLPLPQEWKKMSPDEKNQSKRERLIWHAELPPIETRKIENIILDTIELASSNYRAGPGARPGFVLEGDGTLGKTTILQLIGRRYEIGVRANFGLSLGEDVGENMFIPVAYITLSGTVTIKSFNREMAKFYGIPVSPHATEPELTEVIELVAGKCGTTLILIDDIHFLKMRNKSGQDVNNHLKALASKIPATFGYAGVDLNESGLFLEGRSEERRARSQTAHRFSRYLLVPFKSNGIDYLAFLKKVEEQLCLVLHKPGDVLSLQEYIHERTKGYTGAIAQLLKLGARKAIREKKERLSIAVLDGIKLANASESSHRRRRG
ncbi:AAA family ATPase [Variovorax ureilyticus]|uniref:AAA family ATPase n=1 Tax=Variovorax ureilyticus TaxID=1836198 RepID=A0ABU8VKQ9_9BURK